jgi:hypothetical protein
VHIPSGELAVDVAAGKHADERNRVAIHPQPDSEVPDADAEIGATPAQLLQVGQRTEVRCRLDRKDGAANIFAHGSIPHLPQIAEEGLRE